MAYGKLGTPTILWTIDHGLWAKTSAMWLLLKDVKSSLLYKEVGGNHHIFAGKINN